MPWVRSETFHLSRLDALLLLVPTGLCFVVLVINLRPRLKMLTFLKAGCPELSEILWGGLSSENGNSLPTPTPTWLKVHIIYSFFINITLPFGETLSKQDKSCK